MTEALANWPYAPAALLAGAATFGVVLFTLAWIGIPGVDSISRNTIQRLAKNSAAPVAGQLANRAVDLVFAAFVLRLLGATANGQYAVAVVAWLYLKTISDFGLSVLVTREAARSPERAGELLGASTILRILVLLALVPPVAAYAVGGLRFLELSPASAAAIGLLMLSIVPGSYTEAVNSIFNARERMELPAALNVATNLFRACLGLGALVAGLGVIGLALVALVTTSVAAVAYHVALRHLAVRPVWRLTRRDARWLLTISWPLLLNGLLMNLFFRADVFVIQAAQGDYALGVYDAAYKFINTVLLVPTYFTLAVFPILTRYAASDHSRLLDSFGLAVKFMLIIAWPVTLGTVALAPLLIGILGGADFLPDSANALRVLIWFLPWSYVNGITQYVLVAVDRQRSITWAFAAAVAFNLAANLALVPIFSFYAAAGVTVATEVVIFAMLALAVRRYIGPLSWAGLAVRPTLAAAAMGLTLVAAWRLGAIPATVIGCLAYAVALVVSGAVGRREADIALALLGRARPAAS
ncbi:MAG: flippase [Sphaerobacter sp.]|nr:flippase [Sphaerobacter sp.]